MDPLEEIDKKLAEIKGRQQQKPEEAKIKSSAVADIFAGVIVGLLFGIGTDRLFNTEPIFLIIFLILGFAGGMLNIYKKMNKDN